MRTLKVMFEGYEYKIRPDAIQAVLGAKAAYDGRVIYAARVMLGEHQWAIFRQRHNTVGELDRLVDMVIALQRTRKR